MFDLGEDFVYGIFTPDESEVVGGTGLHPRVGDGALEIGYWLRASRVGRGFAREAAAALTTVAFRVCDVDRVEIRVDPANEASLRIPRSLGFTEEAVLKRRLATREGEPLRDVAVFSLFAEQLAGSPVAAVRVEAYDALGRVLPV